MSPAKPVNDLPSSSLTEEVDRLGPGSNKMENQVQDTANVAQDLAKLEPEQPRDSADLTALQYPALELSVEPSGSQIMYVSWMQPDAVIPNLTANINAVTLQILVRVTGLL
jgi:hypothetical protein